MAEMTENTENTENQGVNGNTLATVEMPEMQEAATYARVVPVAILNVRTLNGYEHASVPAAQEAFARELVLAGVNLKSGIRFTNGRAFSGTVGLSSEGALWAHARRFEGMAQEVCFFGDIRTARRWLVDQACRTLDTERAALAQQVSDKARAVLRPFKATPGRAFAKRRRLLTLEAPETASAAAGV